MSADDQAFLDVVRLPSSSAAPSPQLTASQLNSVGSDVKRFSGNVTDFIERQVDTAASALRNAINSQAWIPDQVRPKVPANAPVPTTAVALSLHQHVSDWVLRNKLLTGTFVLGITATSIHLLNRKRKSYSRKRRAKRASNGARLEVVVIAGSPSEPIVRSLALDLERRGFIVFVICNDFEEEVLVQNEARADIRPLSIDISRVCIYGPLKTQNLTI